MAVNFNTIPTPRGFTEDQWSRARGGIDDTGRVAPEVWQGFTREQQQAIISLRRDLRSDGQAAPARTGDRDRIQGGNGGNHYVGRDPVGGGRGGPRGPGGPQKTLTQALDEAKAAPGHARVKDPFARMGPNKMMALEMNVENLFRESKDATHDDGEFTEAVGYTKEKFYKHMENIAQVIKSLNGGDGPQVIGMIEVEDKRALEKLVGEDLQGMGYQTITLEEGHDARGIDVGLISKYPQWPGTKPRLIFSDGNSDGQRGVLRVELNAEGKRLVVYVNHWKSMRDGEGISVEENNRIALAVKADRAATEDADPNVAILMMGDLNTKFYGGDSSAIDALGAKKTKEEVGPGELWDVTNTIPERRAAGVNHVLLPEGTHSFRGGSDFLDRVMANKSLIDGAGGIKLDPDSVVVIPNAGRYFGKGPASNTLANGVSDHKAMVSQYDLG